MAISLDAVQQKAKAYTDAWNSGVAGAVAAHFAADSGIVINRGDPWVGRAGVAEMASGFFADVPDLTLTCNDVRLAGDHVVYVWTFEGHDAGTGNALNVKGWEEWDLNDALEVVASRGWFDADDYARQVAGA